MHEEKWILLEDYISESFIFKIIFIFYLFCNFCSSSSCIYGILRVIVFFIVYVNSFTEDFIQRKQRFKVIILLNFSNNYFLFLSIINKLKSSSLLFFFNF